MLHPTIDEIRKLAREKFGRDLTDEEAQRIAPRLPSLAASVDLMSLWQSKLGETAPATNFTARREVPNDR
jgi:hypothetical protein